MTGAAPCSAPNRSAGTHGTPGRSRFWLQLAAAVTSLAVTADLVADLPSGVRWRWWQIVVIACSAASTLAALLVLLVQVLPLLCTRSQALDTPTPAPLLACSDSQPGTSTRALWCKPADGVSPAHKDALVGSARAGSSRISPCTPDSPTADMPLLRRALRGAQLPTGPAVYHAGRCRALRDAGCLHRWGSGSGASSSKPRLMAKNTLLHGAPDSCPHGGQPSATENHQPNINHIPCCPALPAVYLTTDYSGDLFMEGDG